MLYRFPISEINPPIIARFKNITSFPNNFFSFSLQIPIYWAKPSIPHSTMKEHPDIVKFCHFSAYVRTRFAGILRGLTP